MPDSFEQILFDTLPLNPSPVAAVINAFGWPIPVEDLQPAALLLFQQIAQSLPNSETPDALKPLLNILQARKTLRNPPP